MRPYGKKDSKKRKRKKILTSQEEREIIAKYCEGESFSSLSKSYNISKSALSCLIKNRKIKTRINHYHLTKWKKIICLKNKKIISGIYAILFVNKINTNTMYVYIGSSNNILKRIITHQYELNQNKHCNKKLQNLYNNSEYLIKYFIIEECSPNIMMKKEREYIDSWNESCLLNTWRAVDEKDIRPWLEKAVTQASYTERFALSKTKIYNETPCKESTDTHKASYGRMQVLVNGNVKYLTKHRVAYWEKHGEYPELVRHLCNNPKCYNSDHLDKGNHKDNILDRRRDFSNEFEKIWLKNKGDLYKISKHYEANGIWKLNQNWNGYRVSYSVYDWEKKLNLRTKYPSICKDRISKLRKKQAEKKSSI